MELPIAKDDYLQQYRNISAKLKKRFLRKPNVAEASEDFGDLQRLLSEGEVWHGAGLCCIAVARCHHSLSSVAPEIEALVQAGRCYAKAEDSARGILCPSSGDHLLTSVSCYQRAVSLLSSSEQRTARPDSQHSEKEDCTEEEENAGANIASASLSLELAMTLQSCDQCSESLPVLQSAVDSLSAYPSQHLFGLEELQKCYIMLGDLDGALKTSAKILSTILPSEEMSNMLRELPAAFQDTYYRCEVLSVLLLLLLQPLPSRTPSLLLAVRHKYTPPAEGATSGGDAKETAPFHNTQLFSLLQCLSLTVSDKDRTAVQELSKPLTVLLHHLPYHLHLLHLIVMHVQRG